MEIKSDKKIGDDMLSTIAHEVDITADNETVGDIHLSISGAGEVKLECNVSGPVATFLMANLIKSLSDEMGCAKQSVIKAIASISDMLPDNKQDGILNAIDAMESPNLDGIDAPALQEALSEMFGSKSED